MKTEELHLSLIHIYPDMVVNFAAESHVDRSIEDPGIFLQTNIIGTSVLMDACRKYGIQRLSLIHIFVLLPLFFISVIDTKSKFIKVIDTLIAAGLFLGILGLIAVSYTHLDVYKRQAYTIKRRWNRERCRATCGSDGAKRK